MTGGRWRSVRSRLMVWNMAVLALALAGSSLAFCLTIQGWMSRSVRQELRERIHQLDNMHRRDDRRRPRPFGPPPPPFGRRSAHPERGAGYPLGGTRWDTRPGGDRPWPAPAERAGEAPPLGLPARPESAPTGPYPQGPLIARAFQGWPDAFPAKWHASLQFVRGFDAQGNPWFPRADLAWDPRALAAALAGREQYSTVTLEGVRLAVLTVPHRVGGRVVGALQAAADLNRFDPLWRSLDETLLALLPLSLLVAGIGGLFLTRRALRPVHEITQAAARIGAADLSQRLEVTGPDEFGKLAATFNAMIQRLEQAFRRQEAAFEEQRRFAADASHELRTPLARIKASATLALRSERPAAQYRQALHVVNDAADVMNRIVQDLLLLARGDADRLQLDLRPLSVGPLLEAAAAAANGSAPRVEVVRPDPPLAVTGHQELLLRLLGNLIENALRHTPEAGRITVSARAEGDELELTVADTGEGIPPEHLPHLCERFYRVDAARSRDDGGAGLGLAICQSIAQAHGGRLAIESEVGQGTTVRVRLPRAHVPARELAEQAA